MPSERIQRRIEQLLDDADQAIGQEDWELVRKNMRAVLTLDPENADAQSYLAAAERGLSGSAAAGAAGGATPAVPVGATVPAAAHVEPTSFANDRYEVKRFLGEGGKKQV